MATIMPSIIGETTLDNRTDAEKLRKTELCKMVYQQYPDAERGKIQEMTKPQLLAILGNPMHMPRTGTLMDPPRQKQIPQGPDVSALVPQKPEDPDLDVPLASLHIGILRGMVRRAGIKSHPTWKKADYVAALEALENDGNVPVASEPQPNPGQGDPNAADELQSL